MRLSHPSPWSLPVESGPDSDLSSDRKSSSGHHSRPFVDSAQGCGRLSWSESRWIVGSFPSRVVDLTPARRAGVGAPIKPRRGGESLTVRCRAGSGRAPPAAAGDSPPVSYVRAEVLRRRDPALPGRCRR